LALVVNAAANQIIATLGLAPLPNEGGYFRVTSNPPSGPHVGPSAHSSIWFLITPDGFSALHRLKAKELWNFHAGDAVAHVQLDSATAQPKVTLLGLGAGAVPSVTVPAGVWQGARLMVTPGPCGWAFFSCSMFPAWDEKDFELGARTPLLAEFPSAADWIEALTR